VSTLPFRIGEGYDIHALVPGRKLILGGVLIPHDKGLLGHSDADVLLHAITDALLGAAGLGDIGEMFPDTAAAHQGADSRELLKAAAARVRESGWDIGNIDCTVIAEAPKLQPHKAAMRMSIAQCLGLAEAHVNIKGKTNEKLGHLGRGEGIAATAVCLLLKV
jgi:2-C-methyl-D-erythritol 2,4-cyclodiphosphate synthase